MGDRPDVRWPAPAQIVALDVSLLAQHLPRTARLRLRHPLPRKGAASPLSNLGISVTREVHPFLHGRTASSLRIPEFRSIELVLDDMCKWSCHRSSAPSTSTARPPSSAACPGSSTCPAQDEPAGGGPLPPRRRVHRDVARPCARSSPRGSAGRPGARLRRRLPARPGIPLPGRAEDAAHVLAALVAAGSRRNGCSWPVTRAAAGWPTPWLVLPPKRPPGPAGGTDAVLARGRPPPRRGLR